MPSPTLPPIRYSAVLPQAESDDPNALSLDGERRTAELLGKEAALFVPTGTMGNQIALHLHARPGEEVICDSLCHILRFEMGGMAALSGLLPRTAQLVDMGYSVYSGDDVATLGYLAYGGVGLVSVVASRTNPVSALDAWTTAPGTASASVSSRISASTPAAGAGTSWVTLSVSSSTRGSSAATASPACLNHWPTVASTTDSPKVGTRISVAISSFARSFPA